MGNRKFQLPGEEQLNKDQDRVLALPEDGQYLIVGGPGTGKSVVALLRALKYHKNKAYVFLVYNKVLKVLSQQLLNTKSNEYLTILHWFYHVYERLTGSDNIPKINKNGYSLPNYKAIIKKFEELELSERLLHIIIDEGQDMPHSFYDALQHAGYINFFIVADQNQQITEDHSSRQELTNLLALESDDVIELKINYRNSHPIALFAQHFYTDKSSPPPDLPDKSSLETPVLYISLKNEPIYKMILKGADNDDRELIGVVVANNEIRNSYINGLKGLDVNLDNTRPVISSYSSSEKKPVNIDFSQGGIVVLNDKSVKGLEFDSVYIILDGFRIINNDTTSVKKRLYVMSSRAIKKLSLVSSQKESDVLSLLPSDELVMKKSNIDLEKKPAFNLDDIEDEIPF